MFRLLPIKSRSMMLLVEKPKIDFQTSLRILTEFAVGRTLTTTSTQQLILHDEWNDSDIYGSNNSKSDTDNFSKTLSLIWHQIFCFYIYDLIKISIYLKAFTFFGTK